MRLPVSLGFARVHEWQATPPPLVPTCRRIDAPTHRKMADWSAVCARARALVSARWHKACAEPAEEAEDAHGADDADGEVDGAEGDEGHADDEEVEEGPRVGEEGAEPVGAEVGQELEGEDGGEGGVQVVEELLCRGDGAVRVGELLRRQLHLQDCHPEVLPAGIRAY